MLTDVFQSHHALMVCLPVSGLRARAWAVGWREISTLGRNRWFRMVSQGVPVVSQPVSVFQCELYMVSMVRKKLWESLVHGCYKCLWFLKSAFHNQKVLYKGFYAVFKLSEIYHMENICIDGSCAPGQSRARIICRIFSICCENQLLLQWNAQARCPDPINCRPGSRLM